MDDPADHIVGAAEEVSGRPDVTVENGVPDPGAADDVTAFGYSPEGLHGEPQGPSPTGEEGLVSFLAAAEAIIVADEEFPDAEPPPEDVPDEASADRAAKSR